MKYLVGWWKGAVYSATSGCCRVALLRQPAIQLACELFLAYLYVPNFKHRLQKILLMEKKMIGWLFYNWEYPGDFG